MLQFELQLRLLRNAPNSFCNFVIFKAATKSYKWSQNDGLFHPCIILYTTTKVFYRAQIDFHLEGNIINQIVLSNSLDASIFIRGITCSELPEQNRSLAYPIPIYQLPIWEFHKPLQYVVFLMTLKLIN